MIRHAFIRTCFVKTGTDWMKYRLNVLRTLISFANVAFDLLPRSYGISSRQLHALRHLLPKKYSFDTLSALISLHQLHDTDISMVCNTTKRQWLSGLPTRFKSISGIYHPCVRLTDFKESTLCTHTFYLVTGEH